MNSAGLRELSIDELEPLATGAWVLGAGGGGSPYFSWLNLRKLYREDGAAKAVLDWAASRTNDAAETSLDRLMQMAQIGRSEAVELARTLDETGCGEFIVGRKGWKSRIRWTYSLRSLGSAAQGQTAELKEIDPEVAEDAVDQQQPPQPADVPGDRGLTIAEAKRGLATMFGVNPEAIEIIIRS